LTSASVVCD